MRTKLSWAALLRGCYRLAIAHGIYKALVALTKPPTTVLFTYIITFVPSLPGLRFRHVQCFADHQTPVQDE